MKEIICVRSTGKNYPIWKFQFKSYTKGKGLRSHLYGVSKPHIEKVALDVWEIKDAQIIIWILNTIDPQMTIIYVHFQLLKKYEII